MDNKNFYEIVPTPSCLEMLEGAVVPDLDFIQCSGGFFKAAKTVMAYAELLHIGEGSTVVSAEKNSEIAPGGYDLSVTENKVTLSASDEQGAQHGFATLVQLMFFNKGLLPCCHIADAPGCEYRGVMIDLARNWHPAKFIKEYIDLCWLFKIRFLHLHFTDDQSYTLPSDLFPNLATEGRCYTKEEIAEFSAYADKHGVELIPEIDVPGHCRQFSQKYGEIFGCDGIIAQAEISMKAMQSLFGELCDMFPNSKYVHIGGDEAAIMKWTEDPEVGKYAETCGIDFATEDKKWLSERLLANFVQKMADVVLEKGRTPLAWEGFGKCVNEFVSRDILIFSWENFYQTAPELIEAGFKIINGSWNPMYVVTPVAYWPVEEVGQWNIRRWKPVHPQSPYIGGEYVSPESEQIIGGQLLAWGDAIPDKYETVEQGIIEEQRLVEERAVLLAEKTWAPDSMTEPSEIIKKIPTLLKLLALIKR